MTDYYGDFPEDHVAIRIPFNTFTSDDPAASSTITNLADSDIHVHKDGSLTQIATDGASVVINFDGITGNHMVLIDSSVDAAYSTGSEYAVRIEGTTVDAGTINAWIGAFSIERAGGVLALTKLIQAAVITNAAGADVAADIIALKTVADGIPTTAMRGTDGALLASSDGSGLTEAGGDGDHLTGINLPNQTMDITGNLSGSVGSVTGHTAQTGDSFARLGTPADTNIATDIANSIVSTMTTQMTESYAADGTAPTPAQALMLIQQALTEFAIASTTTTIKKLDGSSAAATLTLDDATNPTSATRST